MVAQVKSKLRPNIYLSLDSVSLQLSDSIRFQLADSIRSSTSPFRLYFSNPSVLINVSIVPTPVSLPPSESLYRFARLGGDSASLLPLLGPQLDSASVEV